MTTDAAVSAQGQAQGGADPVIKIRPPRTSADMATIIGIVASLVLVAWAISMGHSDASFFDLPSVLIVVCGTITATAISYSGEELRQFPAILGNALLRKTRNPTVMARQLLDIATLTRKKGLLALAGAEAELRRDPLVARGVQLATDGYSGDDIERVMGQEIDALAERHRRAAGILRRASEIAPAMGLIGTLVGLVQMLASLDDPDSIGPAMAVALLTTFYGAIMGMVILAPLGAKLERNSGDESRIRTMIMIAMSSIARQENPRRLEMLLNSELPPDMRVDYFD